MIKYQKYQVKNEKSAVDGKWLARALHDIVSFEEFIAHMAAHHCSFSEGTIRGVIIEMETCLRELLLEGKAVRLDDLGILSVGIVNQKGGCDTSEELTASTIRSCRLNMYLGKRFRAAGLLKDAKFREAGKYIGDGTWNDPDPEDPTNTESSGGGGGSTQPSGDVPGEGD